MKAGTMAPIYNGFISSYGYSRYAMLLDKTLEVDTTTPDYRVNNTNVSGDKYYGITWWIYSNNLSQILKISYEKNS